MKKNCSRCNAELNDDNQMIEYPKEFAVYKCPSCGHENEWWTLYNYDKIISRECIIRALLFESYYNDTELNFDQVIKCVRQIMKENISEEKIRKDVNTLFNKLDGRPSLSPNPKNIKIHKLKHTSFSLNPKRTKIHMVRYPITKSAGDKYSSIKVLQDKNNLADFFNKRVIRQWDIIHLSVDLNILKEIIKSDKDINYNDRWIKAIDHFISLGKIKNSNYQV